MPCQWVTKPDGTPMVICERGPRKDVPCDCCGKPSAFQCDYPVADGKTCDKHLCPRCRVNQGYNVDYCPEHAISGKSEEQR